MLVLKNDFVKNGIHNLWYEYIIFIRIAIFTTLILCLLTLRSKCVEILDVGRNESCSSFECIWRMDMDRCIYGMHAVTRNDYSFAAGLCDEMVQQQNRKI
jgi:hypothetical protein